MTSALYAEETPALDPVAVSLRGKPIPVTAFKSVDISSDGKYVAAGNGEGKLFLWDLERQELLQNNQVHENWTFDVHFSPDGKRLATAGGDNLTFILPMQNDLFSIRLGGHTEDVHGVRFFNNSNRLVTGGDDKNVRIWNLDQQKSDLLEGHTLQVTAVAINKNDTLIASASRDKSIRLWDPETLTEVGLLEGHTADVLSVDFSKPTKEDPEYLVSASYDKTVRIWDVKANTVLKTFDSFEDWVFAARFDPAGKWLAIGVGNGDFTIRNWKTDDLIFQHKFPHDISGIDFSDTGDQVVVSTSGGHVYLSKMLQGFWIEPVELPLSKPTSIPRKQNSSN
ncbi:MAG: WD40 repeat domain-containing protein [Planctomycetaceae bacterium]